MIEIEYACSLCFMSAYVYMCLQVSDKSDRLIQLQRCMLQHDSVVVSQGDGSDSLVAFLALMAAVLTECDLHCHSQRLREMATRLGHYIPQHTPLTFPS